MHNANLRGIDCYQSSITRKARENRELKQATFLTKRTPAGSESSRYGWREWFLFEITNVKLH